MSTPPDFPLEGFAKDYFAGIGDTSVEPTGFDKSLYLDIAETIVREAASWQDANGRIIDPVIREEWNHCSPRYASSVAPLIRMGRCEDLLESCVKCIDAGVRDLVAGVCKAPDFTPRDLCLAIDCLGDRVGRGVVGEWKGLLGGYDPQKIYTSVTSKKKQEDLHNFSLYNLTGEQMKRRIGAADNIAFIEEHLVIQLQRFNSFGLYRDPNCPMTYDLTDRQNLVLLLNYGYDGRHRAAADEMLRRGGLTQLFYQSTTGQMPYGGRSNQFHHMEGMACCNAEFEASRYARLGNRQMASVFKRAARRAAASVTRWILDVKPFRHVKNMFPRETLHGCDSYGHVAVYSLLASNLFAYAALIADDSIEECAAPCDVGGYVVEVGEGFHRVFASCGPLHIQIDTCGQLDHDPTGLGRIHHRDKPPELGLSMGIVSKPHYRTAEPPHSTCIAIGPCWPTPAGETVSLAALQPSGAALKIMEEGPNGIRFSITYNAGSAVTETYQLTPKGLDYTVSRPTGPLAVTVPMLVTDGAVESTIHQTPRGFRVAYRDHAFSMEAIQPACVVRRLGVRAPNRNGIYDIASFEARERRMAVRLTFE
ncbi:MAG: hypothetical protein AB1696_11515 [Planctomycetota bacterium]